MVISSSNRAPSPMSTRPNPNPSPNLRTLHEREGVIPARKSFSGYPLGNPSIIPQPRSFIPNTPANSPAEYARRSFSRDHEQKENEGDHPNSKSLARPRSPSVSKGSKHFMSPTISAASKMNPSPRKKVLGERNEAIRTSASLSDGKFQFFSTSSLEFSDENEPRTDTEIPTTDFLKVPEKDVVEFSSVPVKVESEPDLLVLSPEVPLNTTNSSDQPLPLSEMPKIDADSTVGLDAENSCSSPSIIAPLDAEPSLPAYDRKTNFLSPRPQFLCYKPNPRIESYINQGLRLEDEFGSEANSETENSEETHSESSAAEQEDSSSSSSSSETSPLQEKPLSPESNSTDSQKLQEAVEAKVEPKPPFFTKWKAPLFVLIILLGFITFSVTYDPSFENVILRKEAIFKAYNDPHVVVDLAKAHFNGLSQSVKLWSAYSLGHLSQFIHSSRAVNFSPLVYSNLTGGQEEEDYVVGNFEMGSFFERKERDFVVGDYELSSFVKKEDGQEGTMDTSTENFASNPETEEQEPLDEEPSVVNLAEKVEENSVPLPVDQGEDSPAERAEENSVPLPVDQGEDSPADVEDPNVGMMDQGEDSRIDVEDPNLGMMDQKSLIDEAENQEVECAQVETEISVDFHDESQIDAKAQNSSSYGPEFHPEVLASSEPLAKDDQSSCNDIDTEQMAEDAKSDSEMLLEAITENSQLLGLSERSLTPIIAAVIFGAVSLLTAAAAFIFMKPKKDNLVISAPLAHRLLAKEKLVMEKSVASVIEPSVHEYAPSWSGPVEVDMISEPCPSEMSSFQKTSSYSKSKQRGADEVQSQSVERRPKRDHKRESLASSSSSSEHTMCSYGSFTTYSKIPSKKGDEEVVTPVRRSSRIRNQVTSP